MTSARRIPLLALAGLAAVLALSGCTGIKPGSVVLTQPTGIGPLNLRLTLCTVAESEVEARTCGPVKAAAEGQMLLGLVVPVGTTVPATIATVPSPGATPTTLNRSQEVTQVLSKEGPPAAGFELVGYISGAVAESAAQTSEWALAAELRLPVSGDGGSYGLPFTAGARSGWREVSAAQPAGRPVKCATVQEFEKGEVDPAAASCPTTTAEGDQVTLGISDLKIKAPAATAVAPGAKVKLPFVLDFASSATALPKFKLTTSSKLPGAGLSVSNNSFSRGPSNPVNNRAPATTRQAIVQVPATARLGSYELAFTATAAQGGSVTASTQLLVKPSGKAAASVPKKVKASVASSKGVPVVLTAPIAGTRFQVVLKGPERLSKKTRIAKAVGAIPLRMKLGAPKAQELLEAGTQLRLEVKANVPGSRKPTKLVRRFSLR